MKLKKLYKIKNKIDDEFLKTNLGKLMAQRAYHHDVHINKFLNALYQRYELNEQIASGDIKVDDEFVAWFLASCYHDMVQLPFKNFNGITESIYDDYLDPLNYPISFTKGNNEHNSFVLLQYYLNELKIKFDSKIMDKIHTKILGLSDDFNREDYSILNSNMTDLIEYEHQIFQEYQSYPLNEYIQGRVEFLENYQDDYTNIKDLIEYVKNRQYKIGIYAGAFNPFHIGHYDVLTRAEKIFDKVIVCRCVNPDKVESNKLFPWYLLNRETTNNDDLLGNYINSLKEQYKDFNVEFSIVKGVRHDYDFRNELEQAKINQEVFGLQTAFISTDKFVSSSMIRQLEAKGIDVEQWVNPFYGM